MSLYLQGSDAEFNRDLLEFCNDELIRATGVGNSEIYPNSSCRKKESLSLR